MFELVYRTGHLLHTTVEWNVARRFIPLIPDPPLSILRLQLVSLNEAALAPVLLQYN